MTNTQPHQLTLKQDSYDRYTRILQLIPEDCIAKYPEEWLDRVFLLLEKKYESEELIREMVGEVYTEYQGAVKKAMIDYILMEESEMERIGVFKVFQPPVFYGQEEYNGYVASKEVQRKNRNSREVLQDTLSLTSEYVLKIQTLWKEHEDKLLIDLPKPSQQYITIEEF